jgi:hypothetical protein
LHGLFYYMRFGVMNAGAGDRAGAFAA